MEPTPEKAKGPLEDEPAVAESHTVDDALVKDNGCDRQPKVKASVFDLWFSFIWIQSNIFGFHFPPENGYYKDNITIHILLFTTNWWQNSFIFLDEVLVDYKIIFLHFYYFPWVYYQINHFAVQCSLVFSEIPHASLFNISKKIEYPRF